MIRSLAFAAAVTAAAFATGLSAQPDSPPPDLADLAAGTYRGDVISDSRGSSRSGVTITISKTGSRSRRATTGCQRFPRSSNG